MSFEERSDNLNTPVGVSRLDLILANFTCFFFKFNSCLCLTFDYNEGERKGLATRELKLSWILIHSMTFPISNVKGPFCKLIDRKRLLCSEFTSNLNITANITP